MIEQGLVGLVQADGPVAAMSPAGGFFAEVPKDFKPLPTWTYQGVSLNPNTTLLGTKGLRTVRWQIDCYGDDAAQVITLANAIDNVLDGYQGNLADQEQTYVSACILTDSMDFFDDYRRSYRRMLEYEVLFAQD
jgi:hypothetical protein